MSGGRAKRHLDFELNLIPFIDLLSTCICFLLMTAVWTQVGTVDAKQAVGGQAAAETEKKPTVWVSLADKGILNLEVRDSSASKKFSKVRIDGVEGRPDWTQFEAIMKEARVTDPQLTTALIQPTAGSVYEEIIDLMDKFRGVGVVSLGVQPL
jgi:biopolymer transport protein TolR